MAAYKTKMPLNSYWRSVINCVISAFILRASACTVNDIFDRRVDAAVGESDLFVFQNSAPKAYSKLGLSKDQSRVVEFQCSPHAFTWWLYTASESLSMRRHIGA